MSALNWSMQEDVLAIATDTLALDGASHTPSFFTTKIYPLLHLDGVVCGTGDEELITKWYTRVQAGIVALSVPHLDRYTTPALRELATSLARPSAATTTIYQYGFDPDQGRFRAFAYRSTNEFVSEELPYGFAMKPAVEFTPSGEIPADFINLIARQRDDDQSKPLQERIGIGGDVHLLLMTPGDCRLMRVHRFEDYPAIYDQMVAHLPHPF